MDIENDIVALLKKTIEKYQGPNALKEFADINLSVPKNKKFGDFSTNVALILAQRKKRPPLEIARQIQKYLQKELENTELLGKIEKTTVEGAGFVNFFLANACLYKVLLEITKKKDNFGRLEFGKGKGVHIEFVSANPTGPLNVAHGRQAAFGDSLANLLEFSGYRVKREYYLNDEGVQIDILGESVCARYLGLLGIPREFPASGYRGKYIDDLANQLVRRYGRRFVNLKGKKLSLFSHFAYQRILEQIKNDLNDFGVKYNSWFSQKKLSRTGKITKALKLLKKKGFLYPKEGAWWLATSKFGDDKDRVVIKSDSKLTYIAPDIAYHQTKFKRGFSKMLNVWGPDHHGYIPRIKAALSALGYDAKRLSVLIVQLVSLARADEVIPMSTRAGEYISLREIIQAVGKDAARFFFLMRKRDSHLHFDLELAKSQSLENPVYYIQYAYARSSNILKFAKISLPLLYPFVLRNNNPKLSLLNRPEELSLIQILRKFPSVVEACAQSLEPHRLTVYLQELAKGFHHYYERIKVVSKDLELTGARSILVNAVRIVLKNGLCLLAIKAPEKM